MTAHLATIHQRCDQGYCTNRPTHRVLTARSVVIGSYCRTDALAALQRELATEGHDARRIQEIMSTTRRTFVSRPPLAT